ncbi:uncharacterized protein [Amphiura filiformis]|uniref:uncharacterized protein n=1 Tax=Amphiura filiformis TaxID=82378 RepID=UPI003B21EC05
MHECTPSCDNGGVCVPGDFCICPSGFSGPSCNVPDPECTPSCDNSGVCVPGDICVCPPGFSGPSCNIPAPVCEPVCNNNGVCITGGQCLCPFGFTGATCDIQSTDFGFAKPVYVLKEGSSIEVTVLRVGVLSQDDSVDLNTADATATKGYDYIPIQSQEVLFVAGVSRENITVSSSPLDLRIEGEERFELCLDNPSRGSLGLLGLMQCTSIVIEDCDTEIAFGDTSYSVVEGIPTVNISIIRRGYSNRVVSVDVVSTSETATAKANKDYEPIIRHVVFGASDDPSESMFTFMLGIKDDNVVEHQESFHLVLRDEDGAIIGLPNVAEVTIEDNDVMYCFAEASYSVAESATKIDLTIVRTGNLHSQSSVVLYTIDGTAVSTSSEGISDYISISSAEVSFDEDQTEACVSIFIINDDENELPEVFSVRIISNVPEELCKRNIVNVTIINDDFECETECQNGGVCVGIKLCMCAEGFTGDFCEEDIDECSFMCTDASVHCVNTPGSYRCQCRNTDHRLFKGVCKSVKNVMGQFVFREHGGKPVEYSASLDDPESAEYVFWKALIENELMKSTFKDVPGIGGVNVTSLSDEGTGIGVQYNVSIDALSPTGPTEVGQAFMDGITPDLFIGDSTIRLILESVFIDGFCPGTICQNGGSCVPTTSATYACICLDGFYGTYCENVIPSGNGETICPVNLCENGGTCLLLDDQNFVCSCPEGFIGNNCEIPAGMRFCAVNTCLNNGICFTQEDGTNTTCRCLEGFEGDLCEQAARQARRPAPSWVWTLIGLVNLMLLALLAMLCVCYRRLVTPVFRPVYLPSPYERGFPVNPVFVEDSINPVIVEDANPALIGDSINTAYGREDVLF